MRKHLIGLAIVGLALAGCSDDAYEPVADATSSTSSTSSSSTTSASSTTSSSSTTSEASDVLQLGEVATPFSDGTVTVHDFSPDYAPDAPEPYEGQRWAAADIEVCTDIDVTTSPGPWNVLDAENRRFAPTSETYSQFPPPVFSIFTESLAAGECVRGWLPFIVPDDAVLTQVRYGPEGAEPTLWSVEL